MIHSQDDIIMESSVVEEALSSWHTLNCQEVVRIPSKNVGNQPKLVYNIVTEMEKMKVNILDDFMDRKKDKLKCTNDRN